MALSDWIKACWDMDEGTGDWTVDPAGASSGTFELGFGGQVTRDWTLSLGSPSSGTFTLTFGGFTTSGIAYNASAADIQTALEGLTSVGSGNVAVSGSFLIHFQGTLAGTALVLTGSGAGLIGATFAIAKQGIAYNALPITVQNALVGLPAIGSGNVLVTPLSGGRYLVHFQSSLAGTSGILSGDGTLLSGGSTLQVTSDAVRHDSVGGHDLIPFSTGFSGTARGPDGSLGIYSNPAQASGQVGHAVALTVPGGEGVSSAYPPDTLIAPTAWTLSLGGPTAGTFTLTVNSATTPGIAYNASANAIRAALEGLSGVGAGSVGVTAVGSGFEIAFGGTLEGALPSVSGSGSGLTGGSFSLAASDLTVGGESFFVAGWVYINSANATVGGDGYFITLNTKAAAGAVEWALEYNHDDHVSPSVHGLGFTVGTPSNAHDPFDGTLLTLDAWNFLFCWYDSGTQTAYRQVNNGTIFSYVTGAAPIAGTGGVAFGGNESGAWLALDGRLDAWVFGKGGVPSSGDRSGLWNAGVGIGCSLGFSRSEALTLDEETRFTLVGTDPPPGGSGQPKVFSDGSFLDSCDPSDARATVCTRTTRTIPSDLATHLAGESLTLAYCLRLVRRDATTYGFTTCDKDLTFDPGSGSMTFEALNSLSVTALRQELGATVGNMDLAGLIRSDRVTAADLLAGRYDGAELTLYLVNFADLTQGKVTLARGWWGAVTLVDGQWKAEYRSLTQRLQQQIVEQTSPTCRVAQLGDARCGITLASFQFARTVTAVVDNRNFTFGSDSHGSSYYAAGRVIWTAGNNNALAGEVKRSTLSAGSAVIEMQTAFPFTVQVGDTATLEAGCDRRLATCKGRFANVVNFRGEPYVPGSEILRRVKSLLVAG